jgi:DNA segregation ATPase FtsK/SpoIIIE-like protein
MTNIKRFSLTLGTLAKLTSDADTPHSAPLPALPSLSAVLTEFSPLPHAALFLGLANDGLPILLNLLDPLPGPIMIAGDEGSGKTNFLQTISSSVDRVHSPQEVRYSVISDNLSEWKNIKSSKNCENKLSTHEPGVASYLNSMVAWAHSNKGSQQTNLLLIDHLESLLLTPETQQDLRWLLLRGPSRHVWPIATIHASVAVSELFRPWLDSFRTRLFGYMHDDHEVQILTGFSNISFTNLSSGSQFVMRDGNDWLSFWIPTLD